MATYFENRLDEFGWSLMRTKMRTAGAIGKAGRTSCGITVDPFVAGLAADVVVIAELRNRERLPQIVGDELGLKVHG